MEFVVEVADEAGVDVVVGDGVEDFAAPEDIVDEEEGAGAQEGDDEVEEAGVATFVGVDEGEVEGTENG